MCINNQSQHHEITRKSISAHQNPTKIQDSNEYTTTTPRRRWRVENQRRPEVCHDRQHELRTWTDDRRSPRSARWLTTVNGHHTVISPVDNNCEWTNDGGKQNPWTQLKWRWRWRGLAGRLNDTQTSTRMTKNLWVDKQTTTDSWFTWGG